MIHNLMNAAVAAAQQAAQGRGATRQGTVTGYDPDTYAIKVMIQPDQVLTGWIPLKSPWVGNGWGMFCPPSIGDQVEIDWQEDDAGVGSGGWRFYNDEDVPLPVPSGEFWLVHQAGSKVRLLNDGSIEIVAAGDMRLTAAGTITSSASAWNHSGPVHVDGTITATGDVTAGGTSLEGHRHGMVKAGSDQSGPPA